MKKILLAALLVPAMALAQTYPSPTFNSLTLQNPLTAANGGTGTATSTGTGSAVLSNSPVLVTPNLGTPSAVTLTNGTGLPISTGISGLGTGVAAGLANAVTGSGSPVLATSPTISSATLSSPIVNTPTITSPTVTGAFTATGLVTTADLATQAANTVLANATSASASPTALAVPSCSTSSSALGYTTNSGITCNTAINAATLGGATFAAPGNIGTGTPGTAAFTSLSASTTNPSLTYTASGTGAAARSYASKFGDRVSPMDYGAVGNGTTNDTTAVQNAITAAAGKTLDLSGHFYCVNALTVSVPTRIVGGEAAFQSAPVTSGLKACSINQNLITFAAGSDGSVLENVDIVMNAAGQNTSGYALTIQLVGRVLVEKVTISDPCFGILEYGNNNTYDNVQINGFNEPNNSSCGGVVFGSGTNQALDTRFINSAIVMPGSNSGGGTGAYNFGMSFINAGGVYVANTDILFTQNGTQIAPGAGQTVQWLFFNNTVLGDSTYQSGLYINPASSTGVVEGISIQGSWVGSSGCWPAYSACTYQAGVNGVTIANTNSGTVNGVMFNGFRQINAGNSNIAINTGVSNVKVQNSMLCAASLSGAGATSFSVFGGSNISITGNRIAGSCAGSTGSPSVSLGIAGASLTGPIQIHGNDLTGTTTPLAISSAFATTQTGIVISDNAGVDDTIPSVASASSITLPPNPIVYLTGSSAVSTMSGGWQGRKITIIAPSGATFTTGGNIANSGTWGTNQASPAIMINSTWAVHP